MATYLASPTGMLGSGRHDLSPLLASPAQQPWAQLLTSPAPAAHERRLSFDVLTSPCTLVGGMFSKGRSASHPELFSLAGTDCALLPEDAAPAPATQEQQHELQAALTQKVTAKTVQTKQAEVEKLVAGVAAKFGLTADYGKAEETIKAPQTTGGEQLLAGGGAQPAAKEEPTLGKGSSDHASCDEEMGQHATSILKAGSLQAPAAGRASLKRPLDSQPSFSFQAHARPSGPGDDAGAKRRRVQYDRMRELEARVQRVRHVGDALSQSLRQAEAQHAAAVTENEQLWNALLHIHASLRAAHGAQLRQQVAMHAAAVAAVLPPSMLAPEPAAPTPGSLFGGMFSPDAGDLAGACGMFISPAKASHAIAAGSNKPRKLFLEESAQPLAGLERPALGGMGELAVGPSPVLWVQAA